MVGRANKLARLDRVVARAIDFQAPQVVTIVGNHGTGKTRLINEWITKLATTSERRLRVFHGAAERDAANVPVALAAVTSLLRDRFDLTPDQIGRAHV